MAEIDPVILQLIADTKKYQVDVQNATRVVEQRLDAQGRSVQRLEKQFKASSGRISATMKGLAGSLAAAFSVRQVQQYADSYTQYTNQLKVAGLEGEALAKTQEELFGIAQRYGVELESLGTLYSRGAQVSRELGASQAELIQFSSGVAAALKVQGGAASSAQGALLQLSQALGSGTVRAEEFNSINEGALPILKAVAANLDAAGGSVAKLKNLVNDGKVSSDAFFRAFLKGTADLEAQAARSSLTIGNSFTVLNNALGKFIGETDQSLSATERVSQAIIGLSENLDTVSTALVVISTVMVGRFAAGMVAGATATGLTSTAVFALQARAAGAATTMEALALTSRAAGTSMLAAFGGPVGLAVTALVGGIIYLATRTNDSRDAALDLAVAHREASKAEDEHRKVLTELNTKMGEGAKIARDAAKAAREKAQADLAQAQAALKAAIAEREKAKAQAATAAEIARAQSGAGEDRRYSVLGAQVAGRAGVAKKDASVIEAQADIITLERRLKELQDGLDGPGASDKPIKLIDKGKKSKGPTAAELEARHNQEMSRLRMEELSARLDLVTGAEERAALQKALLDEEYKARKAEILADEDLTKARKAEQLKALDVLYKNGGLYGDAVSREKRAQLEEEALDIASARNENERDLLSSDLQLADNREQRRDIELRLLDLAYDQERAELEAVLASVAATDAQKKIAAERLRILDRLKSSDTAAVNREYESPVERYRRGLEEDAGNLNDIVEESAIDAMDRFGDSIANTSAEYLKLGGVAGDVINGIIRDLIRLAVQQTVVKSIMGAISSAFGGSVASDSVNAFDSNFRGLASGTNYAHGGMYNVGESGPERVFLPRGSKVMPATQTAAMGRNSQPMQVVVRVAPSPYFDATVDSRAANVAAPMAIASGVESSRQAQQSMMRRGRNRIP
ncbi:tape measure protein [Sphingosinicella xenopeptidilytica]|uniref:Tape measure protein n=1 Tax=Sphingosinicella xenopeptidilytica TaxID=364098 RepID=A0ABW3C160_SPHXN